VSIGRTLGASIAAVAVLYALSALAMPVLERRPGALDVALTLALLLAHAALYWHGERVRARVGLSWYAGAQGATLFAVALTAIPGPIAITLFMLMTLELVLVAGQRWRTVTITAAAIALYVIAELLTSGLYRATTAGVLLALTGALAHAVAALMRRRTSEIAPAQQQPVAGAPPAAPSVLSAREVEVLREVVSGARNSDIAGRLGISERTVKSHLASIYQKLVVERRAAAAAAAVQRRLV
jgi:DNA-binding CsgD family transcriptional regulator